MNTKFQRPLLIQVLLLFLTVGCATKGQVKEALLESNDVLLRQAAVRDGDTLLATVDLPGLIDPNAGGGSSSEWKAKLKARREEALAKLDAFIEANRGRPGLEKTVDAIRLRMALILLVSGEEDNLARAVFESISDDNAGSARDRALYRYHDTLIWWWRNSQTPTDENFQTELKRHLGVLNEALQNDVPPGTGIYYYFGNLRAHLHLRLRSHPDSEYRRPDLRQGLREYCGLFDEAMQEQVRAWAQSDSERLAELPLDKLRWIGQVGIVFAEYEQQHTQFLVSTLEGDPTTMKAERERLHWELKDSGSVVPSWPMECDWLVSLFR